MTRAARWLVTVVATVAAGALLGERFGRTLYALSWDYIPVPGDYIDLGLRLGLVAGTALAAAQVVGHRPMPSGRRALAAFVVLGVVALAAVAACGSAAVLLQDGGYLGAGWRLPNPRRHALFLGLDAGARAGALVGSLAGAWLLRRGRGPAGGRTASP